MGACRLGAWHSCHLGSDEVQPRFVGWTSMARRLEIKNLFSTALAMVGRRPDQLVRMEDIQRMYRLNRPRRVAVERRHWVVNMDCPLTVQS